MGSSCGIHGDGTGRKPQALLKNDLQKPRLDLVLERGTLRVGYFKDHLPYAFNNAEAHLVGLDVEMAHRLAKDLGVTLRVCPFESKPHRRIAGQRRYRYHYVWSGDDGRTCADYGSFAILYGYDSWIYREGSLWRDEFSQWSSIQGLDSPRIGIPNQSITLKRSFVSTYQMLKLFPMESVRDYFKKEWQRLRCVCLGCRNQCRMDISLPTFPSYRPSSSIPSKSP